MLAGDTWAPPAATPGAGPKVGAASGGARALAAAAAHRRRGRTSSRLARSVARAPPPAPPPAQTHRRRQAPHGRLVPRRRPRDAAAADLPARPWRRLPPRRACPGAPPLLTLAGPRQRRPRVDTGATCAHDGWPAHTARRANARPTTATANSGAGGAGGWRVVHAGVGVGKTPGPTAGSCRVAGGRDAKEKTAVAARWIPRLSISGC